MTARERFLKTISFEPVEDRAPMVEWAAWWDKTADRWKTEGLDPALDYDAMQEYFGLDKMVCLTCVGCGPGTPAPQYHCGPIISDEASYEAIRPFLFTQGQIDALLEKARRYKAAHERGDVIIRLWLDGFFWFPRTLFGVEEHFYAFYDQPELMKRINTELAAFNIQAVRQLCAVLKPDMVGFAEDMSYNHGPMLSLEAFDEFLLPYYRQVIPVIKENGIKVLIDSDGDITTMVPWMERAGIDGVYPLERQAGVDIAQLRRQHPRLVMMGGFDKMTMPLGEGAMREEFERILPVIRSGGYVPSVDHQTPPGVSLENYRIYLRLFEEYCKKAARQKG